MGFLERFNNKTKGNNGLIIIAAIGVYIATLLFLNINFIAEYFGLVIVLVGIIVIAILAELRGEQLLPVVILLFMSRLFHVQLSEGVHEFYIRLASGNNFQWYQIIDFIASLYLWMKLIALLLVERKGSSRLQRRWMPLILSLTLYSYLIAGTTYAIYFILPILVGFIVRQERLTLIYILVLLIGPLYNNIFNIINYSITTNNIIQLAFTLLFGYIIYRNLSSLDNDNYH